MYSQFEPSESQPNLPQTATENAASSGVENVAARNEAETLLECYLDQVCANPAKVMTDTQKVEMRQELRAHLLAAAAAYEELGSEPKVAMQEAIERFGNASFVGKGLRQAYRPSLLSRRIGALTVLSGMLTGAGIFVLADLWMYHTGNYSESGSGIPHWIGGMLGFIVGTIVWRKQLNLWRSALWASVFFQTLTVSITLALALDIRNGFDASFFRFLLMAGLVFGTAGAATGAMSGIALRRLRRRDQKQRETKKVPPALS